MQGLQCNLPLLVMLSEELEHLFKTELINYCLSVGMHVVLGTITYKLLWHSMSAGLRTKRNWFSISTM